MLSVFNTADGIEDCMEELVFSSRQAATLDLPK